MAPRLYKAASAFDTNQLRPGYYYWMTGWSGRGVPQIVWVAKTPRGRMVMDGCEYRDTLLSELLGNAAGSKVLGLDKINFWGPIQVPEELS